jgi:hypothetical protein
MLRFRTTAYTAAGACTGHVASDWEVASDSSFNNVIFQSDDDPVNLTEINIDLNIQGITVFVRAKHKSTNCSSPWSLPYQADIPVIPPGTIQVKAPVITIETINENIPSLKHIVKRFRLAIPTMELYIGTANHVATDWYLRDETGEIIWQSENNSLSLEYIDIPSTLFIYNKTYIVEARYITDGLDNNNNIVKSQLTKKKYKHDFFNFIDTQPNIYFYTEAPPAGETTFVNYKGKGLSFISKRHSIFKDYYITGEVHTTSVPNSGYNLSLGGLHTTTNLWNPFGYTNLDFFPIAISELKNNRILITGYDYDNSEFKAAIFKLEDNGILTNQETVVNWAGDPLTPPGTTINMDSNFIITPAINNELDTFYVYGNFTAISGVDPDLTNCFVKFTDVDNGNGTTGKWDLLTQPTVLGDEIVDGSISLLEDNRVLITGGYIKSLNESLVLNRYCYVYYPGTDTWVYETLMPNSIYDHCQITLPDNNIFVSGSVTINDTSTPVDIKNFEYNLENKSWVEITLPSLPVSINRRYGLTNDGSILLTQGNELVSPGIYNNNKRIYRFY